MERIVLLILASFVGVNSLVCKDDHGNDVDWWIAYKFPENVLYQKDGGDNYVYITSNDENKQVWKLSATTMSTKQNLFYRTVQPLYKSSQIQYIFYNDQHPLKSSMAKAHAKGVAAYDSKSGFWIIHSIPNFFPDIREEYSFPTSGKKNGQIAICLSLSLTEMEKVVRQLFTLKPNINMESDEVNKSMFSALKSLVRKFSHVSISPIKTLGGTTFTHFSKYSKHPMKIFKEISKTFGTDLNVQSWRNGNGGSQDSDCDRFHKIKNVDSMHIEYESDQEDDETITEEWPASKDHSKWLVSDDLDRPIVCIGDLNRMDTQTSRGGGYLCIEKPDVWKAFDSSVYRVEDCN